MMWRKVFLMIAIFMAIGTFSPSPTDAQSGVVWDAAYYNNPYLAGNPTVQRRDNSIAFDWGYNSPAEGINSDGFSARWGTDVYLPAGTYRFWARADDNIRITVNFDFHPIIDTFANPAVGQTVTADITLHEGTHHIQVDYRENTATAYAYVSWSNLASNPTGPNFPVQPPPTGSINTGVWTAQYYSNPNLSGSPAAIQSEASPNRNWGTGAPMSGVPADNFSVRWTSTQNLSGGSYRIVTRADDGVRVYVNGALLINEWHGATGQSYSVDVTLPAGNNNFIVEYMENSGVAFIEYSLTQISGGAVPPPSGGTGSTGGAWVAYYYNNRDLAGSPSAILSQASVGGQWGNGSPVASIGADNFSVRWTTTQQYNAGTYRISARADDGVRVYVDGVLRLNQWHNASGQTYTADVTLTAGQHTISVEYYEATGDAFLDFSFGPVSAAPTAVPPATGSGNASGTITVTPFRLNVRSQPDANANIPVLVKIDQGETYPIVGCIADRSWWQINVNGTIGWVFSSFVDVHNATCSLSQGGNQTSSDFTLAARANVNMRSGPSVDSGVLGVFRIGNAAPILGRNSNSTWWLIEYNGIRGWVSTPYVQLQTGLDVNKVPIAR